MAVNITLYSLSKRSNSTLRPAAAGRAMSGTIKDACSLMEPDIVVNFDPTGYNYFFVSEWDRYYWIRDIVHDKGLFVIRGAVDVLATWKNTILASQQYVLRSATTYDGDIIDTFYPAKAAGGVLNSRVSMGFSGSGTFVVGICGQGDSGLTGGGTTYYLLSATQMEALVSWLYTDTNYSATQTALEDTTKYYFNPLQYIVSVMWVPYYLSGDESRRIKIGWWTTDLTGTLAYSFNVPPSVTVPVPKHPSATSLTAYLNAEPFSRYRLYIPGAGEILLSGATLAKIDNVVINMTIDAITGHVYYQITDGTNILAKMDGQLGVPVALSQVTVNTIGAVINTAQAAFNTIAGLAVGMLNTGSIGNALESNQPTVSRTGADGGRSISYTNSSAILFLDYLTPVTDDNADFGRPLCQPRVLRGLAGFVQCMRPHIAIAGTRAEADSIESYLEGGVYLE